MRRSSRQRQYLAHLGVDVWYQRQLTDAPVVRWAVSITTCVQHQQTWLWLCDESAMSAELSALLTKIQQALGLITTSVKAMTLIEMQQLTPVAAVFLGGAAAHQAAVSKTAGLLTSPMIGRHDLVTVSLQDMLDRPEKKREVWRDLQALQALCSPKASG